MSGTTMSRADCYGVLGVPPYASWEAVRQAYKDLVRVWHPDRFQSDPELQRKAAQQLQRINEAYLTLKNTYDSAASPPEPAPQAAPQAATPEPRANVRPPFRGRRQRRSWSLGWRGPVKVLWFGTICLAALALSVAIFASLRVPRLESVLGPDGRPRPAIRTPGGTTSVTELSQWARSQASSVLHAIPRLGKDEPDGGDAGARSVTGTRAAPRITSNPANRGAPANGTELLRARSSGGSQIWVSNQSSRDVVATLVEAETASPVRSIYIWAKSKVCLRHIGPGVYSLTAEVGDGWDELHDRFEGQRRILAKNGPFQCVNLTVGRDVSGQCFDVNGEEGTSRPKSSIVLAGR